jgi:hypothetical protein
MLMSKTRRKSTIISLALIKRIVGTLGFDGTAKMLELIKADATPEQTVTAVLPYIKRAARRRKGGATNG